jgi:hypothetical protein
MKKFIRNFLYKCIEFIEKIEYRNASLNEDDISKKIIYSQEIQNIQIESDSGWVNVSHLHITQPYTVWNLELDNGYTLKCADNHIIFNDNMEEVFVKNLKIGDYVKTDLGDYKVSKIFKTNHKVSMGDLTINHSDHRYYTNGILSHNTISASIYILHYMLFNNTKNVLLAANKLDTSKEVLDKIKNIYTYLPFFLQQGVENWNVSQIKFENGCRAKAFAMTKNASIGQTGDLVYVDEFAHIQNSISTKFYKSIFPTLVSIENSKMIITSTPDGFNLFHDLLIDAEREEDDPMKNSFAPLRVYWYQVPGRNTTYFKLNVYKMRNEDIDEQMVYEQCYDKYSPNGEKDDNNIPYVQLKKDEKGLPVIHILNDDKLTMEKLTETDFINKNGETVPVSKIAKISTWKLDTIKDIGGLDAFNQEFDLRFAAGSKTVISEKTLERLKANQKEFIHFPEFDVFKKLRWDYTNLKFDKDFDESTRKKIFGMITIDISEGLGQDYSVINMFKLDYKSEKLLEKQKESLRYDRDFHQLKQIGKFRSNTISVEKLAEMAYLLIFEFFNEDNFKVVVEYNNDGKTFLSEIKNVFDKNNNYGTHVILKFKHRMDAKKKESGLKVGPNKNKFVKDYQNNLENQDFIIYEKNTIKEISTFIAHTTNMGNIVYKGDGANDDEAMTIVNMSQGWKNQAFKNLMEDFRNVYTPPKYIKDMMNYVYNNVDIKGTGTNYNSFFDAKKKSIPMKSNINNLNVKGLF